MSLPFGVKQNTWSWKSSSLVCSRNSSGLSPVRQHGDGAPKAAVGAAFAGSDPHVQCAAVLVERMRRNAVLGQVMHGPRADLQLDPLPSRPDDRRVNGAVVVLLRDRDIVLETARNARPLGVDRPEYAVAILDRIDQDPEPEDVRQLFERQGLLLHLVPDRIGLLLSPLHMGRDAANGELLGEFRLDLGDQRAITGRHVVETGHDGVVRFRHQGLEGQFLEFVAHALHAHPAAEGGVDVECLLRDPPPLGDRNEMQGPHIVQPVGELDQQHSDVVRDGEEQFAQVLGLGGLFRHEVEPLDLGQALDEAADLVAEKLIDFFAGRLRVLDRVVQNRGDDRGVIEFSDR